MSVLIACVCVCPACLPSSCGGQEGAMYSHKLELHVVVSYHVGAKSRKRKKKTSP